MVAFALDGSSYQFFVGVRTVNVGGIEKVDAEFQGAVDGGHGFVVVASAVKLRHAHTAQAHGGNGKAGTPSLRVFIRTLQKKDQTWAMISGPTDHVGTATLGCPHVGSGCDRDQRLCPLQYFADFYCRHARGFEIAEQVCENAPRRLRLTILRRFADQTGSSLSSSGIAFVVAHCALRKIAVVFQAAGNVAGANAIQRAFDYRDLMDVETQRDIRGQGHLAGVADEAEAGDVGQGVDGRWSLVVGRWPEAAELRSAGRPRAAVPTWFVVEQNAVMTSLAVLFSVVIERVAASIQDCLAVPFLIAVEMTPVPSALVNSKRSPGWAPPLVNTRQDR